MTLLIEEKITSEVNDVFRDNRRFLKYQMANSLDNFVLASEVSKIYCDKETGAVYPKVFTALQTSSNNSNSHMPFANMTSMILLNLKNFLNISKLVKELLLYLKLMKT
jgi:hypothetical protein